MGDYLPSSSLVTVMAVPEPGTLVLMLAGLCGTLGVACVRKPQRDRVGLPHARWMRITLLRVLPRKRLPGPQKVCAVSHGDRLFSAGSAWAGIANRNRFRFLRRTATDLVRSPLRDAGVRLSTGLQAVQRR
jgi:hypothetical protein